MSFLSIASSFLTNPLAPAFKWLVPHQHPPQATKASKVVTLTLFMQLTPTQNRGSGQCPEAENRRRRHKLDARPSITLSESGWKREQDVSGVGEDRTGEL